MKLKKGKNGMIGYGMTIKTSLLWRLCCYYNIKTTSKSKSCEKTWWSGGKGCTMDNPWCSLLGWLSPIWPTSSPRTSWTLVLATVWSYWVSLGLFCYLFLSIRPKKSSFYSHNLTQKMKIYKSSKQAKPSIIVEIGHKSYN